MRLRLGFNWWVISNVFLISCSASGSILGGCTEFGWGCFFSCYWVSSKWARFSVSLLSSHVSLDLNVRESMALGYSIYPLDIMWKTECSCEELLIVKVEGEGAQRSSGQVKLACPKQGIERKGGSDRTWNTNTFDPNFPHYPWCIYHIPRLSSANAFSFESGTSNVSYVHSARPSFRNRLSSSSKLPEYAKIEWE